MSLPLPRGGNVWLPWTHLNLISGRIIWLNMPSYCYFSCDEAWRKILLLILICDILSLCAQWTFSALQFICDLHSQRVRWMIIDIHVSLWRINLFHVRAHLHHITLEYMHSNRKKALLWLMCLSASTCHVSSSRARVRYITLKWFFHRSHSSTFT